MQKEVFIESEFDSIKYEIENIEKKFQTNDNLIHNARNQLKIIDFDGIDTVVKSFKIPNFINKIIYTFFKPSKAKKSFINSKKLIELDINTPKPIAYVEHKKFGLLDKSFFITEREKYDFTIREVFHHKVDKHEDILKEFARFTYDLHQKGVWHVDYSLGNILITKQEDGYKFSIIDINRMIFKNISANEGLKNFNKFWAKDENDLKIMADEYAKLSGFNEDEAFNIIKIEAQKVMDFKNSKKKFKKLVGMK
ncbi:MAG: lipopolysaccharide kinase InaA family protein [Campylobacterota bacterium]|nr:lipopolysaccharide kinase InaA family protein [Campylobacterota bacterium]